MVKHFYTNIAIRIVIIALLGIALGWILNSEQPLYNAIALMLLIAILAADVIVYTNRINKKLTYFFDSIQNEDFSQKFSANTGSKTLNRLYQNLKKISEQIENIHIENQRQEKYFEAMIEHIRVGIISVNSDGFVVNCNSTAKRVVGLAQLTHIRQIEKVNNKLARLLNSIKLNEEKTITINNGLEQTTLLVKASEFKTSSEQLKLISMHDIKKELDEKELDSWLKLIRVLTHEIMNSIAPVTSLSENLCSQFVKDGNPITTSDINEGLINRTIQGLQVIHEQGQGLTRFVENYRKLTRLPKPEIAEVLVKNLFEKALMLFNSQHGNTQINISIDLKNQMQTIMADESQILQVLLNLLKNSADALAETATPIIQLACDINKKAEVVISVTDNGPGIPPEMIDEIFVPFFTTRDNGNGIGLSISRQLARLNNGSLKVVSIAHTNTTFSLHFT
jgi:nitrogen fixation/metabolism regulation signal transduction histidine kinase